MVIDSFLFFNEFDLLDLRLNILDEYVDKFVLVEATETFSGLPKPLYYQENKERFAKWNHKIVHQVVDGYTGEEWAEAEASPNTGGLDHWCREFVQRENIKKGLVKAGARDGDVVFICDVDEIWNPKLLYTERYDFMRSDVYRIGLKVYNYWLNNRSNEEFAGPIVLFYKSVKNASLNHLKTKGYTATLLESGWHFTSMGGVDALKKKLESYGHQEFNTKEVKDGLEEKLRTGKDFIGRDFRYTIDESEWPTFLQGNRDRYKHLIK